MLWTYHINMRMDRRSISRKMIIDSLSSYEIIEEYCHDKYLPSYLVYSKYEGLVFHVLFAIDVEMDNVRLVTSYYPDSSEWDGSLKKRSKKQ